MKNTTQCVLDTNMRKQNTNNVNKTLHPPPPPPPTHTQTSGDKDKPDIV